MPPVPLGMAKARYDVHPSVRLMEHWLVTLKSRTGRSLDEWVKFIRARGPDGEPAAREWLKKEHGLSTNSAWWLAERAHAPRTRRFDDDPKGYLALAPAYVEAMYSGKRAGLRPIHDAVVALARRLGKDVKVCPCQTMVPLYREHVFAQIKPATNSRIDLGLHLTPLLRDGRPVPARLIDTGGFKKKDRITHRLPLQRVEDVDAFAARWLANAYKAAD